MNYTVCEGCKAHMFGVSGTLYRGDTPVTEPIAKFKNKELAVSLAKQLDKNNSDAVFFVKDEISGEYEKIKYNSSSEEAMEVSKNLTTNEQIIESLEVIRDVCKKYHYTECGGCPFSYGNNCMACCTTPDEWRVTNIDKFQALT